jgi:hypothetical protein
MRLLRSIILDDSSSIPATVDSLELRWICIYSSEELCPKTVSLMEFREPHILFRNANERDAPLIQVRQLVNYGSTTDFEFPGDLSIVKPSDLSFSIWGFLSAAVLGRPWGVPLAREWAIPALTRSRIMSRSNSANVDSIPAIARPDNVEESRDSVNEPNTTRKGRLSFPFGVSVLGTVIFLRGIFSLIKATGNAGIKAVYILRLLRE